MNLFEQKLKKEYDAMVKAMAQLKKSLEDETIARVDLENRMQSLSRGPRIQSSNSWTSETFVYISSFRTKFIIGLYFVLANILGSLWIF